MMVNQKIKRILLICLLVIIVGHEPLGLAIENILSGEVEWNIKKPEVVAKYGENIIRQFFYDYKHLPTEILEQKYRLVLARYPRINKEYSSLQIHLLRWAHEDSGMPLLEIEYEVQVLSPVDKIQYKFTLFFYETYTDGKMKDLKNWRIRWE